MNVVNKIQQIANHYGIEKQLGILQEKCAELIQAASKYNRADKTDVKRERFDVVEEMSDITFMIKQVMLLLGIDQSEIDEVMRYKINRQIGRMGRECL